MPIASFQAYIDNIKAMTGKTPKDFSDLAKKKGFIKPNGEITVKAMEIFNWLKGEVGITVHASTRIRKHGNRD